MADSFRLIRMAISMPFDPLDPETYDWRNPVVELTIERVR